MNLYDYDLQALEWINHNRIRDMDSFIILITKTSIPISVFIGLAVVFSGIFRKNRVVKYKGFLIISGVLINEIIVNLLKYSINRARPYINHKSIEVLTKGGSPSFPSGHATDVFSVAFIFCLLFKWRTYPGILLWLWTFLVCYSRIALGVHYPSDVIGAIIIGAITTMFLYRLFFVNHWSKLIDGLKNTSK
ncbi:MAG: hypothetical protein NVS3B19_03860 [Ginsengibacter sp.]